MGYPLLQILDSDGNVAYDLNDGTTTYVSPEQFDIGSPALDDSLFAPDGADGALMARKRARPCVMSWAQSISKSSVEDARFDVGMVARKLREGCTIKYQHDADSGIRYIDVLSYSDAPSWLQGSIGIPAQYVTVTKRVEGMRINVLRQPWLRGEEVRSDDNPLNNATLLWPGATAGRPGDWAWTNTTNITNEAMDNTVVGPLPNWYGAYTFDIATTVTKSLQQTTLSGSFVKANEEATFSYYVKASVAGIARVYASVDFRDSSGTLLAGPFKSALTPIGTSWTRVPVTATAPTGTNRVLASIQFENAAATSVKAFLTAAQVEGGNLTPFRVGVETLQNDPASTTGPGRVVPIYVHGDARAPIQNNHSSLGATSKLLVATLETPPSAAYLSSRSATLGQNPRYQQAETATLGTDTTSTVVAGSSGGSVARTTFATATLVKRVSFTFAPPAAIPGTWAVYAIVTGANTHTLRMDTTSRLTGVVTGTTVSPSSTGREAIRLGTFAVTTEPVDVAEILLEFYASRASGTVNLDWDFFVFVPLDGSATMLTFTPTTTSPAMALFYPEEGIAHTFTSGAVTPTASKTAVAGPFPFWLPPGLNYVYVSQYDGANTQSLTATEKFSVNYYPRYYS